MFKSARWRSEKNKIKAAFKLHFQASQVPKTGWDTLMVVLIPTDVGRPTVRSEKAGVTDGSCRWNAVYEMVKLSLDAKTGKVHDKIYQFLITAPGSNKGGILGEASINLADYAEAFKSSNATLPLKGNTGAVLHVTIQRMVGDDEGRGVSENGEMTAKPRRRTLQSQLSKFEEDDGDRARNGIDSKDGSVVTNKSPMKFASSRNLPIITDPTETSLQKSHSFDAISASDSDNNSSGRFAFTPRGRENGTMHSTSYVYPLSQIETPQKLLTSSGDWSASTDGSTSNSGEAAGSQDSEENVEKLRGEVVVLSRKVDLSELELQTLRKQIVKESRRAQELFKEISTLKEERDGFKRDCEELKRRGDGKGYNGNKLGVQGEDLWVTLEEIKRELSVERSSNSNLRLQLQKLQESNSELLLEIRDLEEMVEDKNREILCLKADTSQILAMSSDQDKDERFTLDLLAKEDGGLKVTNVLEKKIIELTSELELYKKDREDMEMQMEQLALDYEILKQENHDVTTRLEQTQLREQLRMQYDCSAHLAVISELESHVESLEREIKEQNEAFDTEMASIMDQKVEQEKRAIKAEEALTKARWSSSQTAERLQEEFKTLYTQVTSMFDSNEKLVLEARREASELRSQKMEMEEHLKKKQEDLGSVHTHYKTKIQQLLSLVDFKSKEMDELAEQLKSKTQEFQNQKKMDEARLKDLREEMIQMRTEIVRVAKEKEETLLAEIEELKALNEEKENNVQGKIMEVEMLLNEIQLLREEASVSIEEINNEKEMNVSKLRGEIESLQTRCSQLDQSLSEMKSENETLSNLNKKMELINTTNKDAEQNDISVVYKERGYKELLKDMVSLKERNDLMEQELKDMQERYSEISLKFAEVEGERQQLVMTIRSLKNSLKN
ncbi:Myosin heavy chain-related protein [Rhynchospora pubera]|uniref:Myosin heavy chain-related protein n=1 Tax=Rhynchospora pubera TaxID=906938 RepID=A0AAV8GDE1_9POAL|nr:Myosin heavy chain-related protein [Rhynchospora pubera]